MEKIAICRGSAGAYGDIRADLDIRPELHIHCSRKGKYSLDYHNYENI